MNRHRPRNLTQIPHLQLANKFSPGFTTDIVHADRRFGGNHGGVHQPMHTSTQFGFDKVEDLIGVFQGSVMGAYNYARQGTPTTAALEAKLTRMEGGVGTVSFATGMGAIAALFFTLLKAGDHLVPSRFVFGNTSSMLDAVAGLGISVTRVDATSVDCVVEAVRPNTRMVFVEAVANPGTQVADLAAIRALCVQLGTLFVADNTILSLALFKPAAVSARLVLHSLTKTIAGHGHALGGAIVDTGLFDWSGYPNIAASYRKGDAGQWGLTQLRKKGLRDLGAMLSA